MEPIDQINTATYLRMSQGRTLISNCMSLVFSVFNDLKREVIAGFADISWIVDDQCLNTLYNTYKVPCNGEANKTHTVKPVYKDHSKETLKWSLY
jgi:hypothetical protein